jgi:hypothetical protein
MVGGLAHSGRVIFAAGAETVAVFPTFAGEEIGDHPWHRGAARRAARRLMCQG